MKTNPLPLLLALLALPVVTASAAMVSYTDGSQVNLLNAYNAVLAVSGTDAGSNQTADQARFMNDSGAPTGLYRNTTTNPAATLDFGAVRTVKTISTTMTYSNYGFTAATVETSNDNSTWTTYTGGVTVSSGTSNGNNVVTLASSVSGRYVRLTPTAFVNGASGSDNRWIFTTMRAFGDTGTLAGDANLTIIANGGFSQAQTLTAIGSIGSVNGDAIMTPAANPHVDRTVLYSIGDGEGFQLDLGQTFSVDKASLAVDFLNATTLNPIVLSLYGSTTSSSTGFSLLGTYTWTSDVTFEDVKFSFTKGDARWVNYTFSSALDLDMRVSDFALFQAQAVPEPSTYALAALGVSAVLFRLRRKQRAV